MDLKDKQGGGILVRAANWVGDAVMTTPVIRAVKKNFPSSRLTLLAKPWVAPVFDHNPYVDRVMIYKESGRHKKGLGTLRLARDLRRSEFDLAVLMQNAFEAALITFLAGIPQRLGYNTDGRGVLLNPAIPLNPGFKERHLIDYYRQIVKKAGLIDDGPHLHLFLTDEERAGAEQILAENDIDPTGGIIGINPGATGGNAKRWFPERFAKLAERLCDTYATKVVVFGGPADRKLGEYIRSLSKDKCVNLAGKTTLRQAFALIARCAVFITNDSGLMHAASALDVNQLALIGPTDHRATAPYGLKGGMVRSPVPCSPCRKKECPVDHKCMKGIGVDMVFEKACLVMDKLESRKEGCAV
ncbi:MAG: lipopolysaccharide heptosyltransferase II [Desulfarculaceae bacterium]|nr:lipopolysaccharide heptosyltransferase II [Desulfarculaceae bacterium]